MAARPSAGGSVSLPEQSGSPNRTSAPYGQACTNCAKAKCKCILIHQPNSGAARGARPICERCARLGRECKPSSSIRRRGAAVSRRTVGGGSSSARGSSNASVASRAANLEQRLEDLVAILKAQATSTPPSSTAQASSSSQPEAGEPHQHVRPERAGTGFGATTSPPNSSSRIAPGGPTVVTPASTAYAACSTTNTTPSPVPAPVPDTHVPSLEAEETLAFFREHHLKLFPFMYLPPETTAAQLQSEKPYLWLNITALCSKSPIKQAELSRRSRTELAHRILVTCERNMDMLLGTLCLLGWTMHLCFKPSISATMGMATAIVTDLRLDKPSQEDDPRILNCFKTNDFVKSPPATVRTMEERRATLGCYFFVATGSTFLRCGTSARWTPHMEDSLRILAANPEWEGDEMLVLMVRLRRLGDGISQIQTTGSSECDGHGAWKPPHQVYGKYFYQCLQTIKDQLPESLKNNRVARSLILSVEMTISEIPFHNPICWNHMPEWHVDAATREAGVRPVPPQRIDMARLEASYATLQTSKAFFKHFLTFEIGEMVGFSFPVLLNFFRAAQILYRLRVLEDPGWDATAAVDSAELLADVEHIADRFNQVSQLYGYLNETDAEGNEAPNFYTKCARTFISTLPMWRAHFAQAEAVRAGHSSGSDSDPDSGTGAGTNTTMDASSNNISVGTVTGLGGTDSQMPPAMMGAGLASTATPRMNYPGMTNFTLPELFSFDFSLDDGLYNEMLTSWDPNLLGSLQ